MALPERIHLEIVTPERHLFSGEVEAVTVPSNTGYLGILPGHAALLAELGIGTISCKVAEREDFFSCCWGFVEVLADRVIVLAQNAEPASDIDENRAEQARTRADGRLHSKDTAIDFTRAELSLLRAMARLDTARLYRRRRARP